MNDATLILSLDTATGYTSVAVTRGEHLLAICNGAARTAHNVQLLECIDDALRTAKLSLHDIDLFAATTGPGTFTGLRTGLATMKGFAATLKRSAASIPTLHAIAVAEGAPYERIMVLLPAGRKEVFAQTVILDDANRVTELNAPRHVAPEIMLAQLDGSERDILFVGEGARLYANQMSQRAQKLGFPFIAKEFHGDAEREEGWRVAPRSQMPLAVAVAKLALKNLALNELVTAGELRAMYVRPSDAELKK